MKKLILIFAVAVIAVCFAACTSSNTPEGVVKEYLTEVQKGNYEKALRLYFNKGGQVTEENEKEMLQMFEEKMKSSVEKKQGIASFEVGTAEMSEDGNSAIVPSTINYGDGTSKEDTNKTVKIDGKWYLDPGK